MAYTKYMLEILTEFTLSIFFFRNMAGRISRDVDIIVGAHSHTLLYTGTPPSGDTPVSAYPTVVTRTDGHTVCYQLLYFWFRTE